MSDDRPSAALLLPETREVTFDDDKERFSTLLDVLSFIAIGVGLAWGLWYLIGPFSIAVGGIALAGLNGVSGWLRRPTPEVEPEPERVRPAPGPSDPGPLHMSLG